MSTLFGILLLGFLMTIILIVYFIPLAIAFYIFWKLLRKIDEAKPYFLLKAAGVTILSLWILSAGYATLAVATKAIDPDFYEALQENDDA